MWTPNEFKDYHPICKAYFKRELTQALAYEISSQLSKQRDEYDPYTPIFARDECLRTDLLECLSYVVSNIGAKQRFSVNKEK